MRTVLLVLSLALTGVPGSFRAQDTSDLEGAWIAEAYHLRDGAVHPVAGRIFFTAADWQVLFFVLDEQGEPRRGSGEGGTYALDGDRLVFTHLFNLSAGEAMEGLAASELRMTARGGDDAPEEPVRVEVAEARLTLHFPSGNRMSFRRRP